MEPALVRRRLTLGLAATTARQGATLRSSRHGGEVWRYEELELGVGSGASFEQVFGRAEKNTGNSKITNPTKLPVSK